MRRRGEIRIGVEPDKVVEVVEVRKAADPRRLERFMGVEALVEMAKGKAEDTIRGVTITDVPPLVTMRMIHLEESLLALARFMEVERRKIKWEWDRGTKFCSLVVDEVSLGLFDCESIKASIFSLLFQTYAPFDELEGEVISYHF